MIHKVTPSLDYNYCLKRLDTQLIGPTNRNTVKASKVVKPTKNKALL